jgi:hypothetical protein
MKQTFTLLRNMLCLLSCLLFSNGYAQEGCPQRYLDRVFPGIKITPNIVYGGNKSNVDGTKTWLAFDLYEPKNDTATQRPFIVLIHGGSFTNNPPLSRKSPDIVAMAKDLARRGYVVASPSYRLFSGDLVRDKFLQTVVAAYVDINEFMCFMKNKVDNGNPYRLDTEKVFMGGSSAGALMPLNFTAFVNDTSILQPELKEPLKIVAEFDNIDPVELLADKHCGLLPKGIIAISGAIVDTNFIEPNGMSFYFLHGKKDKAIPYLSGNGLANPELPVVYGPGIYLDIMKRKGMDVTADIYDTEYHVPIILPFGDSLDLALQNLFGNLNLYNEPILDSTYKSISQFCYRVIGSPNSCPQTVGVFDQAIHGLLKIYPNPSGGIYQLEMPSVLHDKQISFQIHDIAGRLIVNEINIGRSVLTVDLTGQSSGMYFISVQEEGIYGSIRYSGKLLKQ